MPEWPDLHVLRERLDAGLVGRTIARITVRESVVLRATEDLSAALAGRRFESVAHRGKLLLFKLDEGVLLAMNPMLSGLIALVPTEAKTKATTCLALSLDDGRDVRYLDDTRMGKIYLLRNTDPAIAVPGFAELGPDARELGGWDDPRFAAQAKTRRGSQIRNLLLDQSFAAGIGNAYADEILWEARLHPRRRTGSLTPAELSALRQAIADVLDRFASEVEKAMPVELGVKPRGHLKVRGSAGKPCPRCGAVLVLRHGGVKEMSFCPKCQILEGSGPFGAPY